MAYEHRNRYSNRLVDDAKSFIIDNIDNNITMQDICEYLDISETYFIRKFKKLTDLTPYTFILDTKVSKAKELFSKGATISEVVFQMGFFDQSHLNKVFKKYTDTTPNEYRKQFA